MTEDRSQLELDNLNEDLAFAKNVALQTGAILLTKRGSSHLIIPVDETIKGILTDADMAADEFIIHAIRTKFPGDAILTEESEPHDNEGKSKRRWVVDPIDGSNNYFRNNDQFSVSIALQEEGKGIVGVVFAPALNRLYYAAQGMGAFIEDNGKVRQLGVSDERSLDMLTMSFAGVIDSVDPEGSDKLVSAIRTSRAFKQMRRRMLESTALELCYVADGQFDAHFNNLANEWDIAAGEVIVQEARGLITRFGNKIFLASNRVVHNKLREIIEPHITARMRTEHK